MDEPGAGASRRGRPPGTSARELELIALDLFHRQGFDDTTVEQIAAEAGVSSRTFFRYFESKASVLWHDFHREVEELRAALAATPPDVPLAEAIRSAVVGVNAYRQEDIPELRRRMELISTVPALAASAAREYDAWEQVVSEFAGRRLGEPPTALRPLVIGRVTLATARSGFDVWLAEGTADLPRYLDRALALVTPGFGPERPA